MQSVQLSGELYPSGGSQKPSVGRKVSAAEEVNSNVLAILSMQQSPATVATDAYIGETDHMDEKFIRYFASPDQKDTNEIPVSCADSDDCINSIRRTSTTSTASTTSRRGTFERRRRGSDAGKSLPFYNDAETKAVDGVDSYRSSHRTSVPNSAIYQNESANRLPRRDSQNSAASNRIMRQSDQQYGSNEFGSGTTYLDGIDAPYAGVHRKNSLSRQRETRHAHDDSSRDMIYTEYDSDIVAKSMDGLEDPRVGVRRKSNAGDRPSIHSYEHRRAQGSQDAVVTDRNRDFDAINAASSDDIEPLKMTRGRNSTSAAVRVANANAGNRRRDSGFADHILANVRSKNMRSSEFDDQTISVRSGGDARGQYVS